MQSLTPYLPPLILYIQYMITMAYQTHKPLQSFQPVMYLAVLHCFWVNCMTIEYGHSQQYYTHTHCTEESVVILASVHS